MDYAWYTILSLGCSFLVYVIILKHLKTFQFNRFFLLGSVLLCLVAPFLELTSVQAIPSLTEISFEPREIPLISEVVDVEHTMEILPLYTTGFVDVLWYVYGIGVLCFGCRFIKNLSGMLHQIIQPHRRMGNLKLIEAKDHKNTSSFFNYVFINSKDLEDVFYAKSALKHEQIHANELHSVDILGIELILCVFWFNPFVWLYKKVIVQNHEFIADKGTIASGIDIEAYSNAIINSGQMEHRVPLTSGFNFIQIKQRLIMLHQSKSSVLQRTLKLTIALGLLGSIVVLSSFKASNDPFVVVVDAGHGGHDLGNSTAHKEEKDIVLHISNVLASLSNNQVQIIRSRDHDEFVSLKSRVEFVTSKAPDLFLSLHANASTNSSARGVEAFYDSSEIGSETTLNYAEILLEHQQSQFRNRGVKQGNLYILRQTSMPSILLELGFLTNAKDREILGDVSQQQAIAQSLFDALLAIRAIQD
jgi:N-acetylmuramoyl-L-alanine amidase